MPHVSSGATPLAKFCPNCGAPVIDGAVFCVRCGLNVTLELSAIGGADAAVPEDETLLRLRAALAERYAVERELGRGGMATVYLASDIKHERQVAIKVLLPELAASLGAERFEREIRLAAKLQHPHILALYDSGVAAGDLLYYVMPFVQGESLRDRLDREGMLPVEDAVRIALEVCSALGYAHQQGIVHRDIKPENILLSGDHSLVADFGIARAIGEAGSGGQKLTQTGMSVGTPVYMAPEQAAGDVAGPTADLYSLGCVLYEMLAGEPPFTGPNPMAIMARHLMEQVPSVRIVRSAVPEEIENAIFAAMGKLPVDRPQTAAQMAELMGMPLGSTATMRVMRPSTATRRSTTAMAAAPRPWWRRPQMLAAASVVLVAVAAWMYSARPHRPAALSGPETRRLAVLYFDDRSKDSSLVALADGLTDGLIDALSSATSLTVISRSGVERFRGSTLPLDSIGRALRAGYFVRGEVEPERDRTRVTVRLDDASGANLDRKSFTVPSGDVMRMSDSLSALAAELIRTQIGEQIRLREQRAGTDNSAAWLLVQRGAQAQRNAERLTASGDTERAAHAFQLADSLYAAAEAVDGKWVEPPAARAALFYRRSRLVGNDPAAIRPWVDSGLAHVDRALERDPRNANALETRGNLRYWSWLSNLEVEKSRKDALLLAAKDDLEQATTYNRNQAGAWASLSHLYYQLPTSTTNDVYLAAQSALNADEFLSNANVVLYRLFLAAYDLGQFDAADKQCEEFRRRFPADTRAMRCQLYLLTTSRQTNPDLGLAWRLADSAVALTPPRGRDLERLRVNMLVAAAIARASVTRADLADSARHVARRSEGTAEVDPTRELAYSGAFVHTILGDVRDATRLLGEYLAANPQRAGSLRSDPGWWFRELAPDAAFRRLTGG
jgi:TolB-like protein/uncharacterized Zn finger protein (UPF0148 family)